MNEFLKETVDLDSQKQNLNKNTSDSDFSGRPHKGTVGYELRTINLMIHRCVHMKNSAEFGQKASEVHFWILIYLHRNLHKEVFQRDLEAEFEVRRSTMTGILNTMEKNGLIIRESVDYDARLKKLVLTDKAKELIAKKYIKIKEFEEKLIEGVTEKELQGFFATIEKIKKNLNEM